MTDTETVEIETPDHTNLITALQAGPGSRELSDQVLAYLDYEFHVGTGGNIGADCWMPGYHPRGFSPTQSIDDALTLVPEGLTLKITVRPADPGYAHIEGWYPLKPIDFKCYATTPALAICIAILRAKEAE